MCASALDVNYSCSFRVNDTAPWIEYKNGARADIGTGSQQSIRGVWNCGWLRSTQVGNGVANPEVRITVNGIDFFTNLSAAVGDVGEITECPPEDDLTEDERERAIDMLLEDCDPDLLRRATTLCTNAIDPYLAGTWLGPCQLEICESGNDTAVDISKKYNTSGDPIDECSENTQAAATTKCYKELTANCTATPEWLQACVADVCAAEKTGDADPFAVVDGYCGPLKRLQSILDQLSENDTAMPIVNGSLPPRTKTSPTDSWDMCGGPQTGGVLSNTGCTKPLTFAQCQEYCDTLTGQYAGYACGGVGTPFLGARRRRVLANWDMPSWPHGCFLKSGININQAQEVIFNPSGEDNNPGAYDYSRGFGTVTGNSFGLTPVCCGNVTYPPLNPNPTTTTSTTAPQWFAVLDGEQVSAPLQPLPASMSPVTINRPEGAVVGTCLFWGDPHIYTFDGPVFHMYRFGTFWIVQSGPVWIQGYYKAANKRRPMFPHLMKVAVGGPFLKGNTVMIETTKMWWNDNPNVMAEATRSGNLPGKYWTAMNGEVTVLIDEAKSPFNEIFISFPGDIMVNVRLTVEGSGNLPNLEMTITMRQITGQDGHCGTFNRDASDDTSILLTQRFGQRIVDTRQKLIPY